MTGEKNIFLYLLVIAVLVLQFISLFRERSTDNSTKLMILKRDSVLQLKIDSLNANINDYFDRKIYENEQRLENVDRKISVNKSALKHYEKELLQNNTTDSIHNWIKHKLLERSGTKK